MIKIHNDGKEKSFSFEAQIVLDNVSACEFGASEEEAVENLKNKVASIIKELQAIDFQKRIQVDCFGNPLRS